MMADAMLQLPVLISTVLLMRLSQYMLPSQYVFGRLPGTEAWGIHRDTWQRIVYKDLTSLHAQINRTRIAQD